MIVHIVQETCGGIPNDPEVFLYSKDADKRYLELVNAELKTNHTDVNTAYWDFWSEDNWSITDEYEIRYYQSVEVTECTEQ